MPKISVSQSNKLGGLFQINIAMFKGESLPLTYTMAPSSGNADVPSAVVVTLATSRGATPTYSAACTITDNTTSYDVAVTIPAATTAGLEGRYYIGFEETHATFTAKPVVGEVEIFQSVEVES